MGNIVNLGSPIKKRKKYLISIVLIAILSIVVFSLLVLFVPLKNGETLININNFIKDSNSIKTDKDDEIDLQTKVQQLIDTDKSEEAKKLITENPEFNSDFYLHSLLVDLYLNTGEDNEALETLLDMEKKFGLKHYTAAVRIAVLYSARGDNVQASNYYNKAKDLVSESNSPTIEWDIQQIDKRLEELK
jgi:tetratricopeptide (TPR) repeat protein